MKLTIIHYGGDEEYLQDVKEFEFRTNHVANWIRVKFDDGRTETIRSIATIKAT